MKLFKIISSALLLAGMCLAQVAPGPGVLSSGPTSAITGQIQTATGGALTNSTLSFALSQPAIVSGTSSIASSTSNCYTSSAGNIVGVPDPLALPILSVNTSSGTLPAANYYVKLVYVSMSGRSLPSPEASTVLSAMGTLNINAPLIHPTSATGYAVYISTTSGTETLQGTVAGWGQFQQSTFLATGQALPTANSSACNIYFSDQLIPTGTYYTVDLVNKNGSEVAGYPQTWCTYGGSGATINVSNGVPTGNCNTNGVFYPTPIIALPPGNTLQSIAGPLATQGLITNSLNSATVFAEGYPSLQAAANALPGAGGTVNALNCAGISAAWGLSIGSFDPGVNKAVSVMLGPCNFTAAQITIETGFRLIGQAMGTGGATGGTTITATSSTAPLFVLPQSAPTSEFGVEIADLLINGTGSGSADCFDLDVSANVGSVFEYSRLHNLFIQGFGGIPLHLKGAALAYTSLDQFNNYDLLQIQRVAGGGAGIKIEGAVGQETFNNILVNGMSVADSANVYIGDSVVNGVGPFNILFNVLSTQAASVGVNIDGCNDCAFYSTHEEIISGGFLVSGVNGTVSAGILIEGGSFNGNVGVNAGNGYILSVTSTTALGIKLHAPLVSGTPNHVVLSTNPSSVQISDIVYGGSGALPPTTGVTIQSASASTINVFGSHTAQILDGTNTISTIQSSLEPGEYLTLVPNTGVNFKLATGGNITLGGPSTLEINSTQSVTLVRTDTTYSWIVVGLGTEAWANGGNIKAQKAAGCATAASLAAICSTTITWTTAFQDTNYIVTCTGELVTSGVPLDGGLIAKSASAISFQTVAATAAAAQYTNVACHAIHQ